MSLSFLKRHVIKVMDMKKVGDWQILKFWQNCNIMVQLLG